MNELQIKRLLPSLIKKEKVEESRVATPINNIPETPTSTRPMSSNSKYPTRPSTSSRPSTSRSRKGVQYIDKTGKIFYEENSFTEECCSTLPMVSFNLDLQPMQLLSLNSSSPEITSTIFTSMHENRVVLTSRYNFGLSMVLEPDFDSEIKINF